jgi:hypothetical protein
VVGRINTALQGIAQSVEELEARKEGEEMRALRADNKRMREQLAQLSAETKALRTAFSERKAELQAGRQPPTENQLPALLKSALAEMREDLKRDITITAGEMLNARLEEIRQRLPPAPILRPSLAADRKREEAARQATRRQEAEIPPIEMETAASQAPEPSSAQTAGEGKKKGKKPKPKKRQAPPPPAAPVPPARGTPRPGPAPTPAPRPRATATEATWTEVVKGGKAKKAAKPAQAPVPAKRTMGPKLVAPSSAAVVIAIKPEAETDYLTVMSRATTLKLDALGISHVKVKKTATGARMIEVPGSQSGQAADNLAEKLRELIGDVAEVTRPVKKAEVRISGFDESVTPDQIKGEVAAKGRCPEAQIEVGKVRWVNGSGAVIVRCPIIVAKALAEPGRLMLGWSSARVEALEPLPMRCYRCMGTGHTRAMCPSPVDRSDCCFRCSRTGHLARDCSAPTPWCAVCHHAKLAAGHIMGGSSCAPPHVRGKEVPARATGATNNEEGTNMQH